MISAAILAIIIAHQPLAVLDGGTFNGNRAKLLQMSPVQCGMDELLVPACVATDEDEGRS